MLAKNYQLRITINNWPIIDCNSLLNNTIGNTPENRLRNPLFCYVQKNSDNHGVQDIYKLMNTCYALFIS